MDHSKNPIKWEDLFNYRDYSNVLGSILEEIANNPESAEKPHKYLPSLYYPSTFYQTYGIYTKKYVAASCIIKIISIELNYPELVTDTEEYKKTIKCKFDEKLNNLQNKEGKTPEDITKLNNMQSALSVVYDSPLFLVAAYDTLVEFGKGLKDYTDKLQQIQCQLGGHGYNLALMSDKIKPEKGILYVRIKDNALQYTVITPEGNEVTGEIEKNELDNVLGKDQSTQLMDSNFKPKNLKPFLSKILAITSERNHTQLGGPYQAQKNQLAENITKLKGLQLSIDNAINFTDSDNPSAYGSHLQHCIKEFNLVQRDLKTIDLPKKMHKQLQSDTSNLITRVINTIRSWFRSDNKKQTETEPQLPKKFGENLELVGIFNSISKKVKPQALAPSTAPSLMGRYDF